jgi:hypothetical protein
LTGNGQTTVDLRTQTRNVDFTGAVSTKPFKSGAALPAGCAVGELFFKTNAAAGKNIYTCSAANQWSAVIGAGGTAGANYAATFTNQTAVELAHGLNTAAVTVQCFNDAAAPAMVEPNAVQVTDANRVDVSFAAAQSGTCVVSGGAGGSGSGGSGGTLAVGQGLVSDGDVVRVNPAAVRTYLTGSASLDFGTIGGSGGCASRSIPVQGATIGDRVTLGTPAELLTYSLAMTYAVTGAGSVTVRLCNYTAAPIMPPSWTWNADVVRSF